MKLIFVSMVLLTLPLVSLADIQCTLEKPCIQKSLGVPNQGKYVWSGALEFDQFAFSPINSEGIYDTKATALFFSQNQPGKISLLDPKTFQEEVVGTIVDNKYGEFQFVWDSNVTVILDDHPEVNERTQCVNGSFGPYIRKFREIRSLIHVSGQVLRSTLGSSKTEDIDHIPVYACPKN